MNKWRLIIVGIYLLTVIILNCIPSTPRRQSSDENAEAALTTCTVQNYGWPVAIYSRYAGGGYISPYNQDPFGVTPIFSQWHILGIIMNAFLGIAVLVFLLWVRLPGLMGEGQEHVQIIRDSDREEDGE